MIKFVFDVDKSAQAAAILLKLHGGDMDNYVFIKMLYLADKEAYKRWGRPITGDEAVSMEHGPVLSTIYDLTKGEIPHLRSQWERFISDADSETHRVSLKADPGNQELSRAEIKILERIHEQFKDFTWKQMKDYCHDLAEYDATVGKSSRPIAPEEIFEAVGKTKEEIQETERDLDHRSVMQLLFGAR